MCKWWDKVEFFKRLREFSAKVKESRVGTSTYHVVPMATTKSIYFMRI